LAKDNGSSDNITIIVVFFKPIEQLIAQPQKDIVNHKEDLYAGITSTCSYIRMNGKTGEEQTFRFYSNGADNDRDGINSPNPFSDGMSDFGIKSSDPNPFASDGGGYVYDNVVNPFADMVSRKQSGTTDVDDDDKMTSDDGNDSLDDVIHNLTAEKFQQASSSMFDDSSVFQKESERSSSSDFMAHQANAWMPSPNVAPMIAAAPGVALHHFNPFAPKSDSGFISPACNSNNQSEDSAENHEERVAAASVISEDDELKFRRDSEDTDEPDHRGNEVTQLLSGGIIETQFGELMMSARNETPTPPVEDNGSTLEDILAAARDQPDSIDAEDEDDDSDTSGEEEKDQVDAKFVSDVQVDESDEDSSDEEDNDEDDIGFTFVKQDDSAKAEIILKSALDEKDFADDDYHQEQGFEYQAFERTEPLVSQTVEPAFFQQHFETSNVVDLIGDNDNASSDLFTNPFYQDQQSGINQFVTANPFESVASADHFFGREETESEQSKFSLEAESGNLYQYQVSVSTNSFLRYRRSRLLY